MGGFKAMDAPRAGSAMGNRIEAQDGLMICFLPNASMKVNRYSARGMIQISGTDAMSVVIKVVTPSIKVDGTKASTVHSSRLATPTVSTSWSTVASAGVVVTLFLLRRIAHAMMSPTRTASPAVQITLCFRTANAGSNTNGNASSARVLAALLIAYRK